MKDRAHLPRKSCIPLWLALRLPLGVPSGCPLLMAIQQWWGNQVGIVGVGLLPCSEPRKGLEAVSWTEGMACTEAVRWEHRFCVCMYPQTPVSMPTPWCDGVWGRIGKVVRASHGIRSQCLHWFCVRSKHLTKAGEGRRGVFGLTAVWKCRHGCWEVTVDGETW